MAQNQTENQPIQTKQNEVDEIEKALGIEKYRILTPHITYTHINVDKKTYRILRSFVDSSSYQWNTAYVLEKTVKWIKEGKWVLTCYLDDCICELEDYVKFITIAIFDFRNDSVSVRISKDEYKTFKMSDAVAFTLTMHDPVTMQDLLRRVNARVTFSVCPAPR